MHLRSAALAAGLATLTTLAACADQPTAPVTPTAPAFAAGGTSRSIGINVLLKSGPTEDQLASLGAYGNVFQVLPEIHAVVLRGKADDLAGIRALPFVASAEPDRELTAIPPELQGVTDFTGGLSTWNLDAINVTSGPGFNKRVVPFTGEGVYVGVLDTGLLPTWRQYFPTARIAEEFATTFIGGGAMDQGNTPSPPDKWEKDVYSHGTHVTSTIIGYNFGGTFVDGVAPKATIIPVKVLNQNGSGWASAVAAGVVYIANLKEGALAGHPMVVNMSFGASAMSPIEKAAYDFALSRGVILVAAAGNEGDAGMSFPGAYPPVISAAAVGWVRQWTTPTWWFALDVPNPTDPNEFFVADFSSRALAGQDLDVSAPGEWVVGPWQENQGHLSYFFVSGTSMATPHVTGTVALMAEKDPALAPTQAEQILESTAVALPPGCRTGILFLPGGPTIEQCWGSNAAGSGLVQADQATATTP